MANQSQNELTLNPRHSTMRVIAARIKVLRLLSVAAVALFAFVGTANADILVSNHYTGYVENCKDDGSFCNTTFMHVAGSGNTLEGLQCVNLSRNEVYIADDVTETVQIFSLLTQLKVGQINVTIPPGGKLAALATDITGDVLYVGIAQPIGTKGSIYAMNIPVTSSSPCQPSGNCSVLTYAAHDMAIGPGANGKLYATGIGNNTGVIQFLPYTGGATWNPGPGTQFIAPNAGGGGHSMTSATGIVFDHSGNLWVGNDNLNDHSLDAIFEFTGPQNPNPGMFKNFTSDSGGAPFGLEVSPANPPAPPIDSCEGCILVANLVANTVTQIDTGPGGCTGGVCIMQSFITSAVLGTGGPKYVHFTENCCDTGYVEICKMSCLTNPVTGYFTFTATNSGFSTGPLSIPVNACSGPVQIPNGTVTVNEAQQLGIEVSDITAYDYDYQGYQISALLSFNLPFQTGNVDVVSGDVSTETVVGFTNCASGPGELKICKVAGPGVMVGHNFDFMLNDDPTRYHVPAGPAPGGYCVVAKSFPVGTPVLVTEVGQTGYAVSGVTVAPPDRGGTQTSNSVIAIIDSGTTEVTFTNRSSGGAACVGACGVH